MKNYNIYAMYRIDGPYKWYFYVGMTTRPLIKRWEEHIRAVGNVYKKNCKGGKKGEVRNPNTPYGIESNKALYHFIRNELNGIDGLRNTWSFEILPADNGETEDSYIDVMIDHGHVLFNMKDGEGKYVAKKSKHCYSNLDFKKAVSISVEQMREEQLEKAEQLSERKKNHMIDRECTIRVIMNLSEECDMSADKEILEKFSLKKLNEHLDFVKTIVHKKRQENRREKMIERQKRIAEYEKIYGKFDYTY